VALEQDRREKEMRWFTRSMLGALVGAALLVTSCAADREAACDNMWNVCSRTSLFSS
jgi:hypothetical protein